MPGWVDAACVLARSAVPYTDTNHNDDRIPQHPFSWWATIGHSAILSAPWNAQHSGPLLFRMRIPENCVFLEFSYRAAPDAIRTFVIEGVLC